MEKRFDFEKVLKDHAKNHKSKPTHFSSVAGGVKKRLEATQKRRRSSRITIFDSIRNLSRCASPAPLSEAQLKLEQRKQRLEKWKEEKEKKKKDAAAQKKKPFVTGVARVPMQYAPLPPPNAAKPSISGRVTRSQPSVAGVARVPLPPPATKPSTSGRVTRSQTRSTQSAKQLQSFAPKNALFQFQPRLNTTRIPYVNLVPLKPNKNKKVITFEPVLPKSVQELPQMMNEVIQTRSRTQNKDITKSKVNLENVDPKPKAKPTKPSLKTSTFDSSSSSGTPIRSKKSSNLSIQFSPDTDFSSKPLPAKSPRTRKSMPVADSPKTSKPQTRKSNTSGIKTRKSALVLHTPRCSVPKSESSSEERLRSPKTSYLHRTPEQIIEEAVRNSPCVTMSRGKENARKEMKKKLMEGLLDDDSSDTEDVDHFRRQLASEIERMTEMCDSWDRVLEQTALPDSIQECILSAVGQARLLMSQKLQQFASLVERCARPEPGTSLVTPVDLLGFWDMVYMQVENVNIRFQKLEELRARDWAEEVEEALPAARRKPPPARRARPAPPAPAHSRIKDMLAAARKAAKSQSSEPPEKTFDAGFFCVRSPVRAPPAVPRTPRVVPPAAPRTPPTTPSLLKAVLSSEATKASASKFTTPEPVRNKLRRSKIKTLSLATPHLLARDERGVRWTSPATENASTRASAVAAAGCSLVKHSAL